MQYDDGFWSVFDYTCCCPDCPLPVLSLGGVLSCSLHRGVISAVVAVLWSTSMCVWCVVWWGVDDEDQFLFVVTTLARTHYTGAVDLHCVPVPLDSTNSLWCSCLL